MRISRALQSRVLSVRAFSNATECRRATRLQSSERLPWPILQAAGIREGAEAMGFISRAGVPATRWLVASCAVIGLLAGSARAQFDLFDWTAQLPEGSSGFTAEDVMHIEGVELPELSGPSTAAFVTTAPYAGHVVARMSFQNFDFPGYDWPVLIVGRELTVLDTESFDDVIVSFDVAAGGSFGFGVQSDDGLGGPGVVDLEQLMWTPPPVVTKVPGTTSTEALE